MGGSCAFLKLARGRLNETLLPKCGAYECGRCFEKLQVFTHRLLPCVKSPALLLQAPLEMSNGSLLVLVHTTDL